MDSEFQIEFKFSQYSLDDLHALHEFFEGINLEDDSVRNCGEDLEQLTWILSKDNKYVKGVRKKKEEFRKIFLKVAQRLDYGYMRKDDPLDNPIKQVELVINTPFRDLPLIINDVRHPVPKAFLSWRMKINK